mmetsp:Transcript_123442/g.360479  ORF Transcript_123442/g.360479 Transcript_123442/m.360479 type:complete len:208 (+) Transcript_123442:74-697(+)
MASVAQRAAGRKARTLLPCMALTLVAGLTLLPTRRSESQAAESSLAFGLFGLPFFGDDQQEEPDQQQGMDWKEEAYKRQQERIAWRKNKARPDYEPTAKEKARKRSSQLMWAQASRRGMENIYGQEDSEIIEVILEKPLGIKFAEKEVGMVVTEVAEGSPAASVDVQQGDLLSAVDGQEVEKLPSEEAVAPIKAATGPVKLAFRRLI